MDFEKEILNFCHNVKKIRLENNLSKKEMADILEIGIGSLNLIEKNILPKRLSAKVIINICNYFKIKASKLFES